MTAVKVCTSGRWPGAFVCFIVVLMGGQQLASERELGVMERAGAIERELGASVTVTTITPMCLLLVFAACGCSNGSVSEECDQVTGACQCLEGAIGDKCDGCGPDYEGGHDSWT